MPCSPEKIEQAVRDAFHICKNSSNTPEVEIFRLKVDKARKNICFFRNWPDKAKKLQKFYLQATHFRM